MCSHQNVQQQANLSDPYVVVSCHGQSQRTEITRNQVNVLWDRMFVFQDVLLNKDEFERDNIHIQVFDANVIMRNARHLPPSKLTTYLLRRGFPREMTMKWVAMRKE